MIKKEIKKNILKYCLCFLLVNYLNTYSVYGSCKGKFINPITDICWSCFLPFTIGDINLSNTEGDRNNAKTRDIETNPPNPLCSCGIRQPLGVAIGFWEPFRIVDITNTPGCFTTLGGFELNLGLKRRKGMISTNRDGSNLVYSHVHLFVYPITYLLNLFTDAACGGSKTDFGVMYMSELDPTYTDALLPLIVFPETSLFTNSIATFACVPDCNKATLSLPIDKLFWCSGCNGNLFPISGWMSSYYTNAQKISLYIHRLLYKMHRFSLLRRTALATKPSLTVKDFFLKDLCDPPIDMSMPKKQYKLQITYPVVGSSYSESGGKGNYCVPIGIMPQFFARDTDGLLDNGNSGVIIWRKRNCCFL